MKSIQSRLRHLVAGIALVLAGPISAGEIKINTAGAKAADLLEADGRIYAEAQARAAAAYGVNDMTARNAILSSLRDKTSSDVLAVIEYSWKDSANVTHVRRYHARAGGPVYDRVREHVPADTSGTSGDSGLGSDASGGSTAAETYSEANDVARDLAESPFYTYGSAEDVRARILPSGESGLHASATEGNPVYERAYDAELKAFRNLEYDLNKKIVPGEGRVTGWISKAVCGSCRKVINDFATHFDISGDLFQLIRSSSTRPPAASDAQALAELKEQEASSMALKKLKKARTKLAREYLGQNTFNPARTAPGHDLTRRQPRTIHSEETRSPESSQLPREDSGC